MTTRDGVRRGAAARRRNGPRRLRLVTAVIAAALVAPALAACTSSSSSPDSTNSGANNSSGTDNGDSGAPSKGVPKTGGSATQALAGVVSTIDPAVNKIYSFSDGTVLSAIFGMLDYEVAATGKVEYMLLKDMTSNADFTVWTMHVNPGIQFSDGTPFNAEAIKFNYDRFADPATASPLALQVGRFKSMKVVDDLTLEITLKQANSGFPNTVAENLSVIGSPTAIKKEGKDFAQHPVGAGPFKLESFQPNQSVTVVRNPLWAKFKPGQPYLDKITFINLPDYSQQANALSNGQAQMANPNGATPIDILRKSGQNVIVTKTNGGGDIVMNTKTAPFDDPRAREAISLALDRTQAANAFAAGSPPLKNLFQEDSPYYDPKNDFPASDPAKAQQLFDTLQAEGKPVDFVFETISSPQQAPFANYIQAALGKYKNVKVTVKSVPAAQYSQDFRNGRYQMTPHGLYMINPVPGAVDYYQQGGTNNTENWTNATAEAAIQKVLQTDQSDVATLKGYWDIVQQEANKDFPIYYCNQGMIGFVYSKDMVGVNGIVPVNYGVHPLYGEIGFKQ